MLFELRQDGTGILKPQGAMGSDRVVEFKTALKKALGEADRVELDLSEVESMNILNLQLVCSAIRTANSAGKHVTVDDRPCPALERAMEEAGYAKIEQCA